MQTSSSCLIRLPSRDYKYLNNPLHNMHLLVGSCLGLRFNKFLGDYLRDASVIVLKKLCKY